MEDRHMALDCRACGTPHIRRLAVVYEQGLSFTTSGLRGVALAPGGPIIGGGTTRGTILTAEAAKAAPPPRPNAAPLIGFGVIAVVYALFDLRGHAWAIAVGAFLLLTGFQAQRRLQARWREQLAAWNERFVCDRCGWIGVPNNQARELIDVTPVDANARRVATIGTYAARKRRLTREP